MVVKFYKRVKEKRAGVESRIIDSLASKSAYTYWQYSEINDDIYYFIRIKFSLAFYLYRISWNYRKFHYANINKYYGILIISPTANIFSMLDF